MIIIHTKGIIKQEQCFVPDLEWKFDFIRFTLRATKHSVLQKKIKTAYRVYFSPFYVLRQTGVFDKSSHVAVSEAGCYDPSECLQLQPPHDTRHEVYRSYSRVPA